MDNNIRLDSPEEKAEALIKLALCGYLFPNETIELIRTKYMEFATEMTNKEWMGTLDAEQFYDKMMWLIKDYGMRFNNTRLAIIAWLNEPHEVEPTQNKTSNALNALEQENEDG